MIARRLITAFVMILCMSLQLQAQNIWKSILNGVAQGTSQVLEANTIKKVLNNPSLQSADVQNYLKFYRLGEVYAAQGDYANAAESYCGAYNIASASRDKVLKTVWNKYGWADDTKNKVVAACANAGIPNPFVPATNYQSAGSSYSPGVSSSYSSGSSSSSRSTTHRVCTLCNGTGLKIKEHYSAGQRKYCNICCAEKGTGHMHVRCDLCSGTGKLNY